MMFDSFAHPYSNLFSAGDIAQSLWAEGVVTAVRIVTGFNSILTTILNLFMISVHPNYVYLPFYVRLHFCTAVAEVVKLTEALNVPYMIRFLQIYSINCYHRFKKSSSNGVKWELDSTKARPKINKTIC